MAFDYIVGIDIGSYKVCGAVGKIDRDNKLQIIGITQANCNGLKKGIIVDIDKTSEAIINCINSLNRMIDYEIKEAYVSLSGGLCKLFWNNGVIAVGNDDREIRKSDVDRVLNAACMVNIPQDTQVVGILEDQYIVDGYNGIKDPLGMSGLRLEVEANLVLAETAVINNILKALEKAGIKALGVVIKPLAIADCILKNNEKQQGTLILDIGGDTIDASIMSEEKLKFTTLLPVGGNNITNDLSICLKIPFEMAEKLKIKHGSVISTGLSEKIKINDKYTGSIEIDLDTFSEIIKARIEESLMLILQKVKQSEDFEKVSSVVIVGGGISLIKGAAELTREIFNLPVRIGAPDYVGACSPIYSGAVGIVKNVFESKKDEFKEEAYDTIKEHKKDHKKKEKETSTLDKIKEFFTDFF